MVRNRASKKNRPPVKYRFCSARNIPKQLRSRLSRLTYGKCDGVMWKWLRGMDDNGVDVPHALLYVVYAYVPCRKPCKGCSRCVVIGWSAMQGFPDNRAPRVSVYVAARYRGKGYARTLTHRVLNRSIGNVWVSRSIRASSWGYRPFIQIINSKGYRCQTL